MRYFDNYLKFDSQAQYEATDLGTLSVDVVGTVNIGTGQILIDDEGNEYAETVAAEGYYVNVRGKQPLSADLRQFVYTPAPDFPVRRWKPAEFDTPTRPKGDLMAMLSITSMSNVITWMRAEADANAIVFHEYFKAHERFKVKDPVFLGLIDLLYSLGHITKNEKDTIHNC
jgi:hypothetical protein